MKYHEVNIPLGRMMLKKQDTESNNIIDTTDKFLGKAPVIDNDNCT